MTPLERYRQLYQYEIDSNRKMLAMLESVPDMQRTDARFQQAVNIASHLTICRENWLGFMQGEGSWRNKPSQLETLSTRLAAIDAQWTEYLANLNDAQMARDFEFTDNGERFHVPTEVQILQLALHALYHRGQVVLLVDMLGGETVDTDYVDWWWNHK